MFKKIAVTFFIFFLVFSTGCNIPIPTLSDVILRPNLEMKYPDPDRYNYSAHTLPVEGKEQGDRKVVVWHFKSTESKALLVLIPGSDANKSRYVLAVDHFMPLGIDVLLMDYEGFGDSPGNPTLENTIDDVGVVLEFASTLHPNTVVFSVSLGTPLLAYYAGTDAEVLDVYPFKGYIFEGSLIMGKEAELWLRDRGLDLPILWHGANVWIHPQTPIEFDILQYMPLIKKPKLFIHSPEDTVTPFEGGKVLFDISQEPKEFWEVRGDHGRMAQDNPEEYKKFISEWIFEVIK